MYTESLSQQRLEDTPKIKVVIRKRPLGQRELKKNETDIVEIRGSQTVIVRETKSKVDLTKYIEEHNFNFDRTFGEYVSNQQLYDDTVRPIVECLFQGAKVTCFAYGQTGSGKTFTMMGELRNEDRRNAIPGLYLLAARDIFENLQRSCFQHLGVYVSFYEIYCGKLHDLLNDRAVLQAREDAKQNVNIVGLSEKKVMDVNALMRTIDQGNSVRTTSATSANLDSSRSHAILQICLKDGKKSYGKMSFIDLAGSERGAVASDANKQTRMDGAEINKSLLALKECIRALDQDKKHTPFRGSKLTLVLKDSFTGNCKTVMIGNISPAMGSCEHTLNTLRYADRVKELKKPTGDDGPKSQADILARQLMLPRQTKNTTKITIIDEDENEDVMFDNTQKNNKGLNNMNNNFMNNNNPNNYMNNMNNNHNKLPGGMLTQPPPQYGYQNAGPVSTSKHGQNPAQHSKASLSKNNHNHNHINSNNNSLVTKDPMVLMPSQYAEVAAMNPNNYATSHLMNNLLNNLRTTFHTEMANPQKKPEPVMMQNPLAMNPLIPEAYQHSSSLFQVDPTNKENMYNLRNQENTAAARPNTRSASVAKENPHMARNNPSSGSVRQAEPFPDICVKLEDGGVQSKPLSQYLKLVNLVMMEEQEEMAMVHKQYIDSMSELIKKETMLLRDIADPMTDANKYVENVEAALMHKMELMSVLRASLNKFKDKLREEDEFNTKFMNIFDINKRDGCRNGEIQLLEDLP